MGLKNKRDFSPRSFFAIEKSFLGLVLEFLSGFYGQIPRLSVLTVKVSTVSLNPGFMDCSVLLRIKELG
jgi:hypothetical protein